MSRPSARKWGLAIVHVTQTSVTLAHFGREVPRVAVRVAVAVQAPQDLRMMVGEPGVGIGIEADHAGWPVVVDQDLAHTPLKAADLAKGRS